jgi:hypothetical protein
MSTNNYYTYIYLNPLKPGKFTYGNFISFLHEPFYVGKGKGRRCYAHLYEAKKKNITRNPHKIWTIRKIWRNNSEPIISILKNQLDNDTANNFECEIIKMIGRSDCDQGPLTNKTSGGGRGTVGRPMPEWQKRRQSEAMTGKGNPLYGFKGPEHPGFRTYKGIKIYGVGKWFSSIELLEKEVVDLGFSKRSVTVLRKEGKDITIENLNIYKTKNEELKKELAIIQGKKIPSKESNEKRGKSLKKFYLTPAGEKLKRECAHRISGENNHNKKEENKIKIRQKTIESYRKRGIDTSIIIDDIFYETATEAVRETGISRYRIDYVKKQKPDAIKFLSHEFYR